MYNFYFMSLLERLYPLKHPFIILHNTFIIIIICIVFIVMYIVNLGVSYVCVLHLIGISIRLVGGSSYNEGRVEVNYNGEWGTVCDDGWDDTDAGVLCRQLGFGSSGSSYSNAYFGQGSGTIWLDGVTCSGSESTLVSCGHLGVNITRYCSHNEDAGVKCFGGTGLICLLIFLMYNVPTYVELCLAIRFR